MAINGGCDCGNITITWHTVDYSLVPRACQCDYCLSKRAAYVAKSGTRFEVLIRNETLHRQVQQGAKLAVFHECVNCNQVIYVTSQVDGERYGALNANHLNNKFGFPPPLKVDLGAQTTAQKRDSWRHNWCHLA